MGGNINTGSWVEVSARNDDDDDDNNQQPIPRSGQLGSFRINDGDGGENVTFKMNSRFFQTLSRLFQFLENVKCRRISLELISWRPHSSFEGESKIHWRLFTSSIKRKLGILTPYSCDDGKEIYKQACCTCKDVVLLIKPIAVLMFTPPSPPSLLKLPTIMCLWHGVLTNQFFFQSHKPASKTYRPKNDRRSGASILVG